MANLALLARCHRTSKQDHVSWTLGSVRCIACNYNPSRPQTLDLDHIFVVRLGPVGEHDQLSTQPKCTASKYHTMYTDMSSMPASVDKPFLMHTPNLVGCERDRTIDSPFQDSNWMSDALVVPDVFMK